MIYYRAKKQILLYYQIINTNQLLTPSEVKKIKNFGAIEKDFEIVKISRKQIKNYNGRFELSNKPIQHHYQRNNHLQKHEPLILSPDNIYMLKVS